MTTPAVSTPPRPRAVHREPFPPSRRFVIAAMRAGRRSYPVHGLMELDVTEATAHLERREPPLSFTAFVVAAAGRAVAAHPCVHAYRDWRGRLVVADHVDVATMIEVDDGGHSFPLAHLMRDTDIRSVADLSDEMRSVKADPRASGSGRLLGERAALAARAPGFAPLLYFFLKRSPRFREMAGTVAVSSVGMFGAGGGTGIGQPTIMTVGVLIGGRTLRPRIREGTVVPRLVLDLTITVDHAIVDGAPAARFAATLADLIEHPDWVRDE